MEILNSKQIDSTIEKLANEIIKQKIDDIIVIGIQTKGVTVAKRLSRKIENIKNMKEQIPFGILDITLYRDDLQEAGADIPTIKDTNIPCDINNKNIILVDDVLYTGRTIRSALDVLKDFGRPKSIKLAVLVDRGYRELPIQPDFVGLVHHTKNRICVDMDDEVSVDDKVVADDK
ncbi:bifunctional pyr operon transcriptional regulator/uracil phosphoribosyltransferase PyrR [Candidatus Ruminimicrobiellum ovillum]|jgi:pyrimidine operon attenuation protein/uracil phosphoribosyltransferase|uniref:bifunctional pyr operon transcriptional regulator/uracil phosphoribosyltransferase PyrR n=1 Tax=Candidatus Ruminimicrobiellum ovillum TaxID=1947927 RepID=UPI003559D35F